LFIDPRDAELLQRALETFADDDAARRAYGAAALEQVSKLSWSATAAATREALHSIAARSRARSRSAS